MSPVVSYRTSFIAPSYRLFMQTYNQREGECTTSPVNHVLYDDVPVSLVFLIFLEEILQNIICIDRQLLCNQ